MKKNTGTRKWAYWGIGLIVVGGAAIGGYYKFRGDGARGVTFRLTKVSRSDLKMKILSTGVVAAENRLDLKPPVAGRIEKVLVEEGRKVRKGQILAWMSSTERAALIDTAISKGPAETKYWEDSYKMTPILAPSRGLIILKSADAGQTVTPTEHCAFHVGSPDREGGRG